MQYVSELLGAPVRDPAGRVVGKVADLLVPADADYPAIEAVALKPPRGGQPRTVPWSAVRILDDGRLGLDTPIDQVPSFESPTHELSLAHQVGVRGLNVVSPDRLGGSRHEAHRAAVQHHDQLAGRRGLGLRLTVGLVAVHSVTIDRQTSSLERDKSPGARRAERVQ